MMTRRRIAALLLTLLSAVLLSTAFRHAQEKNETDPEILKPKSGMVTPPAPLDNVATASERRIGSNALNSTAISEDAPDECLYGLAIGCVPEGQNLSEMTNAAISETFEGDLVSALRLFIIIGYCEGYPASEEQLLTQSAIFPWINRTAFIAFPDSDLSKFEWPKYSNNILLSEYLAIADSCESLRNRIRSGLHGEIGKLAREKNEAARLLYVLWRPPGLVGFSDLITWQLEAQAMADEARLARRPWVVSAYAYSYLGPGFSSKQIIGAWAAARAVILCEMNPMLAPPAMTDFDLENYQPSSITQGLFAEQAIEDWTAQFIEICSG